MRALLFIATILVIVPVCHGYTADNVNHTKKSNITISTPNIKKFIGTKQSQSSCQSQYSYAKPCNYTVQEIDGDEYNQHEPGYFFAEIGGTYYPDYQTPRFYKTPYCRHHICPYTIEDEQYAEVFYRYYDNEGISREYYYP